MPRLLKIKCVGLFSLMMDRMTPETLESLATKVKQEIKTDTAHDVVAERRIYRKGDLPDGAIGLPSTMLFAALVNAGRSVDYKGKAKLSTAETSKVPAILSIQEEFLEFDVPEGKKEPVWTTDMRRGRLATGVAVCLRRPKFANWGFTVTVEYDQSEINEDKVRELFRQAGKFQGLGSFRPSCKGPFGRFAVRSLVDITTPEMEEENKRLKSGVSSLSNSPEDVDEGGGGEGGGEQGEGTLVGAGAGASSEGANNGTSNGSGRRGRKG